MMELGIIGYGLREFVVFVCIQGPYKGNCYIEEKVWNTIDYGKDVYAGYKFIEDDNLAHDLAKYAEDQGITNMKTRLEELGERNKLSWIDS